MNRNLRSPIGSLPGLRRAAATKLRRAGIFVIGDMLRVSASRARAILGDAAAAGDIRRWLSTAALLQVERMSPPMARVLVGSGIVSVDGLQARSFDTLAEAFEKAHRAGSLHRAPSPADIGAMVRDAAVIWHSGAVTGVVRTPEGKPVKGAAVACGGATAVTDARGRFRILRIPLRARRRVLLLSHPEHGATIVEPAPVVPDCRAVVVTKFVLPVRARSGRGKDAPPRVALRERDGDRLPPFAGMPVREAQVSPSDVDSRELFVFRRLLTEPREAELVSRFRSFEDGEFIVTVCRLPLDRLPEDAKPGEHFRPARGRFARLRLSPAGLAFLRRLRRATGELRGRPAPRTPMERDMAMRELAGRLRGGRPGHRAVGQRPPR